MKYNQFGQTGMKVSILGYGAMELQRLGQQDADKVLGRVLDSGINYIDTSPDYPTSEEKLGKAIAHRRNEFFIATKCACNKHLEVPPACVHVHIYDAKTLARNLEMSLRQLKTDHLDVWQLHMARPEDLEGNRAHETIRFMQDMKKAGKVRAIGVSLRHGGDKEPGFPAAYGFRSIEAFRTWGVFDMMQIVYGGMVRMSENAISRAAEAGLGIKVRGVVKEYFPDMAERFSAAGMEELLEPGEDRHSFLIRYAFSHPSISVGIIGTASLGHLAHNVAAAERAPLSDEVYAEAKLRLMKAGSVPAP